MVTVNKNVGENVNWVSVNMLSVYQQEIYKLDFEKDKWQEAAE